MRSHENLKNGKRRRRKSENKEPNHQIQNHKTTYYYKTTKTAIHILLFSMYRIDFKKKTALQKETCFF